MGDLYRKVGRLGSGTFGQAWVVKRKETERKYVLKEIRVSGLSEKDKLQSLVEVEALARCRHVNIIRYREAFVDKGNLCIIMEYGDLGDLKKKIMDAKGVHFPESVIADWFVQICFALKYIHALKIIHRDLKTQNIFLTSDNILKIGDFGIAKILQDSMDKASTAIGTPFYLSPEICHRHLYGTKSDIWAAGCVLYELCCLVPPFDGPSFSVLVVNIIRGVYKPIPQSYSALLHDLIHILLQVQPKKRPTAEQILGIPALQPYTTAYVNRMRACRDAHVGSVSSPLKHAMRPQANKTEKESLKSYESPDQDKENIDPEADKSKQGRRVSWSTPKRVNLVNQNKIANSVDCINHRITSRGGTPVKSGGPTMSLYKATLQKSKHQLKSPKGRASAKHIKRTPQRISPASRSPMMNIGKTYTVEKDSGSGCDKRSIYGNQGSERENTTNGPDVEEKSVKTSEEEREDAVDSSPDSLEICRHLYNACRSRSMTETYAIMENLRSLLEAKFGSTKFVKDYETIRSALTQGQDFSCVEHVITGDFRLYFPIVIQLVQLECCSKL